MMACEAASAALLLWVLVLVLGLTALHLFLLLPLLLLVFVQRLPAAAVLESCCACLPLPCSACAY